MQKKKKPLQNILISFKREGEQGGSNKPLPPVMASD